MSFLSREINKKLEVVLLLVILAEVLVLAFTINGIRNDFNRNFANISQKLDNYNTKINGTDSIK